MEEDNIVVINTLHATIKKTTAMFNIMECEPKRRNRFKVTFPERFNIVEYSIQNITRPKFRFVNNEYKWDNITVDFIDLIGPSTSGGLMTLLEFCQNNNNLKEVQRPLFSFLIDDLDPTGVSVETWIIDVEDLLLVDFGTLDYASQNSIQTCKLVLKPKRCRIQRNMLI